MISLYSPVLPFNQKYLIMQEFISFGQGGWGGKCEELRFKHTQTAGLVILFFFSS